MVSFRTKPSWQYQLSKMPTSTGAIGFVKTSKIITPPLPRFAPKTYAYPFSSTKHVCADCQGLFAGPV